MKINFIGRILINPLKSWNYSSLKLQSINIRFSNWDHQSLTHVSWRSASWDVHMWWWIVRHPMVRLCNQSVIILYAPLRFLYELQSICAVFTVSQFIFAFFHFPCNSLRKVLQSAHEAKIWDFGPKSDFEKMIIFCGFEAFIHKRKPGRV